MSLDDFITRRNQLGDEMDAAIDALLLDFLSRVRSTTAEPFPVVFASHLEPNPAWPDSWNSDTPEHVVVHVPTGWEGLRLLRGGLRQRDLIVASRGNRVLLLAAVGSMLNRGIGQRFTTAEESNEAVRQVLRRHASAAGAIDGTVHVVGELLVTVLELYQSGDARGLGPEAYKGDELLNQLVLSEY